MLIPSFGSTMVTSRRTTSLGVKMSRLSLFGCILQIPLKDIHMHLQRYPLFPGLHFSNEGD